jgi:hypothetical protein
MASQIRRFIFPITFFLAVIINLSLAQAACTIEEGIGYNNAALAGDEASVDKAIECLEELEKQSPENIRVLGYLGSAYGLKANYSDEVNDKVKYTNFSFDSLDYAVELAPDDIEVRIIRWQVNQAVPSMFGRDKHLLQDLHKLDAIFQEVQSPRLAKLMVEAYAKLAEIEPDKAAEWKALGAKAQNLAESQ